MPRNGRPIKQNEQRKCCGQCGDQPACRETKRCARTGKLLRIVRMFRGGQQRTSPRGALRKNIVHVE